MAGVSCSVQCGRCEAMSRTETLNFEGANFVFLKDLCEGTPGVRALEGVL